MRLALLLLAASTLALTGCGKKEATGNTSAVDQAVSAEDFATNDVTAIDAATGADANMAADVQINFTDNVSGNRPSASGERSRSRPRSDAESNDSEPSQSPAAPATAPASPAPESNSD